MTAVPFEIDLIEPLTSAYGIGADEPHVIYLAGPMTGMPEHNAPAFQAERERLRGLGYFVRCPSEEMEHLNDEAAEKGNDWRSDAQMHALLAEDLRFITMEAQAVQVLPGWHLSRGARAEVAAAYAVGKPVHAPLDDISSGWTACSRLTFDGNLCMMPIGHNPPCQGFAQVH